jgi:hypothetical protein
MGIGSFVGNGKTNAGILSGCGSKSNQKGKNQVFQCHLHTVSWPHPLKQEYK